MPSSERASFTNPAARAAPGIDPGLHDHAGREHPLVMLARNVSTRYVLLIVNVLIGLVMLRFNVQHLGPETWGLWMLAAQIVTYFGVFEFGYGSAVIKFVAEFRARRDVRSLNEVLSTMAYVFTGLGVACYAVAVIVAVFLPRIFNLAPGQEQTGRIVLLIAASYMALYFRFSIYGGVINGFERYYINNIVGLVFNLATALVNVAVLWLGYGLVELVACTTAMRIVPLWIYRRNAYTVFPELQLSRRLFRRDRLRELSGFSIYVAMVDWAGRLTFATDTFFLGVFLNTAAVAIYSVAQRIADNLLILTAQLHTFLMPAVVTHAIGGDLEGQRLLMMRATRFQLAVAACLCGGVAALAGPLIQIWLGPGWDASVVVAQLLALVVVLRVAVAMPTIVLQGTGHHRYVAMVSSVGAAINLALTIPMVKTWGVIGVASATVVAAGVCALLLFTRTCRVVGLGVARGWMSVMFPAIWPALVVIAVTSGLHHGAAGNLVRTGGLLAGGGLLYAALFVVFGLDREERHWFLAACGRVWRHPQLATDNMAG